MAQRTADTAEGGLALQSFTRRGFLPRMALPPLIRIAGGRGIIAALGSLLANRAAAQTSDSITYQGITLRPGDVIDFLGGAATTLNYQQYGHASLYLGVDAQTDQRVFLDFSTTKGSLAEHVQGTPQPFFGRILGESAFLRWNLQSHDSFDVFRLKGSPSINQHVMLQEAKLISASESWGLSGDVCSSAVAKVLSKATGASIGAFTPDDLSRGQFERHPDLPEGRHLAIATALREADQATYPTPPPAYNDVPPPRQHHDIPHNDSGGD
jgi:hypothetical protein